MRSNDARQCYENILEEFHVSFDKANGLALSIWSPTDFFYEFMILQAVEGGEVLRFNDVEIMAEWLKADEDYR